MSPQKEKKKILRRLFRLLIPHRALLALGLVLLLAGALINLLPPLIIKHIIDVDIQARSMRGVFSSILAFFGVIGVLMGVNYLKTLMLEKLGIQLVSDLKEKLLSHVMNLDISYFDKNPVGWMISRVEGDTESIRKVFSTTIFVVVGEFVSLVGMAVIMAGINLKLFSILLLLFIPVVLTAVIFNLKVTPMYAALRETVAKLTAFITESVQGVRVIQAFGREEIMRAKMNDLNRNKFRTEFKADLLAMGAFGALTSSMEIVGLSLVLWYGIRMFGSGEITIGSLVVFLTYLGQFFSPIIAFADQLGVVQRAQAAAHRVFDILDLQPEIRDSFKPPVYGAVKSGIRFRDIWFTYGRSDGKILWALEDVNLDLPWGTQAALVGATGSGKTSIVQLLLRFYESQKGVIEIDGTDIRKIPLDELRSLFAYVPQDLVIFPGPISENIKLGAEQEQKKIEHAIGILNLSRLISRSPQGLEAKITERGSNLSGGERQLLSFARALIRDSRVLLLDEATSSIDPNSERLIQSGIRSLLQERTALIVAHRLSTIRDVHQIHVLHRGRILEQGNHEELMRKEGIYAKLIRIHFAKV